MKTNVSQSGFTLIEVIIAIFLLTIGILGAAAMQIASINGNNQAINLSEAANWGGDTLETLMGLPYDDANLMDLSDVGANAGVTGLDNTDVIGSLADYGPLNCDPQGNFIMFWNVADNYPAFGTKTVRVHIRRNDRGTQKTVTQDFIMMRPI